MKLSTWLDRFYAVLWGIVLAHVMGAEALGAWTLALAATWTLSPWPPTTITTRIALGISSLTLITIGCELWPWAHERMMLVLLIGAGLWVFRMLHAVPIRHRWRLGMTIGSFAMSIFVLMFSRSLTAALWTGVGLAAAGLLPSLWIARSEWGRLEIPSARTLATSTFTSVLQVQILFWLHAAGISERALGSVAAALLTLEVVKVGLVVITDRYDDALTRFTPTRESFLETIRSIAVYGLLMVSPTVLIVFFGATLWIETLFGPTLTEGVPWLRLLVWGFAFSFFSVLGARILQLKNAEEATLRARVAQSGVEALLAFCWIPSLGIEGACYARVLGEVLGFLIMAIQVNRIAPGLINPFRRTFG